MSLDQILMGAPPAAEPAPAQEPAPAPAPPAQEQPPQASQEPQEAPPADQQPQAVAEPEIPEALREQWEELQAKAERAERFAPVLDRYEQEGIPDAQTLQQREAMTEQERQISQHLQEKGAEYYQDALRDVSADIDAAVERGDITPEYAESLRQERAISKARESLGEYEGSLRQQLREQQAAVEQFNKDAEAIRSRDEFKFGGSDPETRLTIPDMVFRGFASAMPQAPLEQVARVAQEMLQPVYDAALSVARASLAKQNDAPPAVPVNGAQSPGAPPARDWRNPGNLGTILASLPPSPNGFTHNGR